MEYDTIHSYLQASLSLRRFFDSLKRSGNKHPSRLQNQNHQQITMVGNLVELRLGVAAYYSLLKIPVLLLGGDFLRSVLSS